MVIYDVPKKPKDYYQANAAIALKLQEHGMAPKYFDGEYSYFKKSPKLDRMLAKIG